MTETTAADLPAIVRTYLAAHHVRDVDTALRTFTPTAVVVDDGTTYAGSEAVRRFLSKAGSEFTYTTTLVAVERDADVGSPSTGWRATSPGASSISATASPWTPT